MIQFAVLGGVILGASAISWYFNQKTENEIRRQDRAYSQRDNIRKKYNCASDSSREDFLERQIEQAREHKSLLLKELNLHAEKIEPIAKSYKELFSIIRTEIDADTTSPYRKAALKKEYAKLEDAKIRIAEYEKYLNFERETINSLWNKGNYGWLMERNVPDALLPLEWLYPGKLLVINMSEIGTPLGSSRHYLKFSGFNGEQEKQQALALSYGDEFPILVVKGQRNSFFGCVARGIAFHDYIRLNQPIEMKVENTGGKQYRCSFANGLFPVNLPIENLINPSLRCVPSQNIKLYFDSHDATLQEDPLGRKLKNGKLPYPSMTEKSPVTLGYDELELFIEVNKELLKCIPSDSIFYDETSDWSFLSYNYDNNEISLGKANIEVQCSISAEKDGLVVDRIFNHKQPQIGIDLPFCFILLTPDFNASELFGWKYGVDQLLNFVGQVSINTETAKEKIKQVEFFKRWQRVLEYQKRQESERMVEFDLVPLGPEARSYSLVVNQTQIKSYMVNEQSIYSFMKEIQKSEFLNFNRSCQLSIWDDVQGKFIPATERKNKNKINYILNEGKIEIDAPLYNYKKFSFTKLNKFKLTVSLPNGALQKQQQALDAIFEDRLVEPRLKEIFLSPTTYKPEFLQQWHRHDFDWENDLTESQEEAIKIALSAKHLAMIQGPPGTGKTTTIVEMLYQILTKNPLQNILVVSQQNTAVDNAITKFKKEYPDLVNESVNIVRVGNVKKIDDAMIEDHFDSVYDKFITESLSEASVKSSFLIGKELNALYEWRALLTQIKDSIGLNTVSDEFFSTMLANKNLLGATCVGLAGRKAGIDHLTFDIAIVDEAGRATPPELLIPLLRSKKAILIGDHHQLPPSIAPVLLEDSAKEEMSFLEETFLKSSFFEVLFEQLPKECTATLKEQFRMSAPIGNLVANLFYTQNGQRKLFNGLGEVTDTKDFVSPDCLAWCDVRGKQQKPNQSTSIQNKDEAQAIYSYLIQLSKTMTKSIDVAVITPYGAQKRLIRNFLESFKSGQSFVVGSLSIKVDTVDSFQGSEAELVCYSTVRTSGSLQFLLDKKRLNVACSRAKENLIFFGHKKYLSSQKSKQINLFSEIINKSASYDWAKHKIVKNNS